MSTRSVRLPDSLHKMAKEIASQDHVSMNRFIAAVADQRKLSEGTRRRRSMTNVEKRN